MNKFKVGDRVRIYNTWPAPIKAIAIIRAVDGDLVRTSYYDNLFHYKQCRKLVKKESMPKFQVGDKVKILNCVPASYINRKGIVTSFHGTKNIPYEVDIDGEVFTFRECDLELVNSVPKFQVGDFVRHITNRFIIGQIIDIRLIIDTNTTLYVVEHQRNMKLRNPFEIENDIFFLEKEIQKLNIKVED